MSFFCGSFAPVWHEVLTAASQRTSDGGAGSASCRTFQTVSPEVRHLPVINQLGLIFFLAALNSAGRKGNLWKQGGASRKAKREGRTHLLPLPPPPKKE